MNIDSFVSLFNGQELDVDVSFHLAMAGLLEKDGNLWEHEKTVNLSHLPIQVFKSLKKKNTKIFLK